MIKRKVGFHFFWGGFLSQWYISDFKIDNVVYNCAEQFMMAYKAKLFNDEESYKKILNTKKPKEQKRLGRMVKNFEINKWNKIAKEIVYKGNYDKFTQNEVLKLKLLNTTGLLVEASPYDTIWGIGLSESDPDAKNSNKWRGKNWLGEILTKLREDLK